jgi:hypothetical protein
LLLAPDGAARNTSLLNVPVSDPEVELPEGGIELARTGIAIDAIDDPRESRIALERGEIRRLQERRIAETSRRDPIELGEGVRVVVELCIRPRHAEVELIRLWIVVRSGLEKGVERVRVFARLVSRHSETEPRSRVGRLLCHDILERPDRVRPLTRLEHPARLLFARRR